MYADLKARLEESIQVMKEDDLKTKQLDVGDWEGFQKEFIALVDKAGRLIDHESTPLQACLGFIQSQPEISRIVLGVDRACNT
jgi:hypothetical protein